MFQTSGFAAAFKQFVGTDACEAACHYALMQLRSELPPNTFPGLATDPLVGFDANAQMVGAARVLQILQTLHEVEKPLTPPKRPTLNYADPSTSSPARGADSAPA